MGPWFYPTWHTMGDLGSSLQGGSPMFHKIYKLLQGGIMPSKIVHWMKFQGTDPGKLDSPPKFYQTVSRGYEHHSVAILVQGILSEVQQLLDV